MYFPLTTQFDGNEMRPIPAECQRAIQIIKEDKDKPFDDSVWIITGVTAVTGLEYQFDTSFEAGSSLNVELAKLLTATAKLGYKSSTSRGITTVEAEKPVIVRVAQPILVKEWVRSGAVSGQERAKIMGETENRPIEMITGPTELRLVGEAT